jgi:hypothetical protein
MSAQIVCPCCAAVILLNCIHSSTALDKDKHEIETQSNDRE